jgi:hypothetical protein
MAALGLSRTNREEVEVEGGWKGPDGEIALVEGGWKGADGEVVLLERGG